MTIFILLIALSGLGIVAASQLVSWLHSVILFGLLTLAGSAMRRDRLA